MRRLAALLTGIVAVGLMFLSLPWESLECLPPDCSNSSSSLLFGGGMWMLVLLTAYVLIPGTVFTAILVSVLRLRDAASPGDAAVRSALGETRGKAVREATRRGAVDAGFWVGGTYAAAGVAHLAMLASTGVYPLSHDADLWLGRLGIAGFATGCLVAAHTIAALRAPRTPTQQLRPESSDPLERRAPLGRRTLVLAAIAACGAGILAGTNAAFQGTASAAPRFAIVVAMTAAWALGLAVAALSWGVLMPLARDAVPRIVSASGTLLTVLRAREVGAVLHARASTRWLASTRVMVVLTGLAFLFGISSATPTSLGAAHYTSTPIAAGLPTGTEGSQGDVTACDADCVAVRDYLTTKDEVGNVVPAASAWMTGSDVGGWVTFINPADLDGVDDVLAAQLRADPSVVLVPPLFGTVSVDDFDALGITATGMGDLPATFPRPIVNRTWALAQMGALESTYFYAYPAAGLTPDEAYDSLIRSQYDGYRWTIERGDRSDWVDVDSSGGSSLAGNTGSQEQSVPTYIRLQNLLAWVVFAALVLVPIGAVATASVSRRRRDDATMLALGASARTLRLAIVVEATVTAAAAIASGLLGGALTRATINGASTAMTGLYGFEINNVVVESVLRVDWPSLLALWASTVLIFIVVSWLASRALRTLSPVEALRPSDQGALR